MLLSPRSSCALPTAIRIASYTWPTNAASRGKFRVFTFSKYNSRCLHRRRNCKRRMAMTSSAHDVRFDSYSMLVEERHETDWYEWCVFVDGDAETLSRIAFVQYTLHPTFSEPVRLCVDREHQFALFSAGWGGFNISITVSWNDSEVTQHQYFLDLWKGRWPRPSEPQLIGDEKLVYSVIRDGRTRWRKERTIGRVSGVTNHDLQNALASLQNQNAIRRHYVRSIDGENLWGATALVGIAPSPDSDVSPMPA
jgi:transcription initiation factor IIF auxiliary subunit